jgi:hypothetical protein
MITRDVVVTIDKEDYQHISNALELARRYIDRNKCNQFPEGLVLDEFNQKEVQGIKEAMDRFWGN